MIKMNVDLMPPTHAICHTSTWIQRSNAAALAEAFERNHKDVLRAIEKIITQVSNSLGKRNFTPSEYEQENNLGLIVKYPMYEPTKDGFVMVVMSFTGEKAMAIKEWYINAFNAMRDKLFPSSQYELKSLPLKKPR